MKFTVVATSLFCAVLALAQTPGFTINTPTNPVQCQPLLISWVGGQGPFFLVSNRRYGSAAFSLINFALRFCVHNGDDPSGPAIADLGEQPAGATSFSWQRVTFQANTRLGFSLRDQTGATAQSAAVTVQAGPDNSCLNGGSSSSGSDSASGTTSTSAAAPGTTSSAPAAPTTTAPGASSTTAAVTSGASTSVPRTSSVTSSGTAAPAQTSNAASAQVAQIGAAGLVGAALVAILA
ncbi:hypothetical protein PC9H_009942 [Pleurotus ostreatus]|uniref:Uncharacterized protein n=1 Tax=Pleurotus ostreatus TaxID=5322 RepID=A0A8H6ZQB4_PLEOS|nr:uncharacterized protein PC9H_009942 [Pleurotus ostreatus]KAF7424634.1 hypothetical protein PC9H_009942 [Pleurotus ostreatus]